MTAINTYPIPSKSRKLNHLVSEHDDGRYTCTCKYFQFKGYQDPIGTCSHIKKVILQNVDVKVLDKNIKKLEQEIKYGEDQYRVCQEYPTDTAQFRRGMEKHRNKIIQMKDNLEKLKQQRKCLD